MTWLPWLAIAALLAGILWTARKSGKDSVRADEAKGAERIADAEKNRVVTVDDLAERLRDGRKL